jgi:hypothetical protein
LSMHRRHSDTQHCCGNDRKRGRPPSHLDPLRRVIHFAGLPRGDNQ